jgi:hypothetical protein
MHYVTLCSNKPEFLERLGEAISLDNHEYQVGLMEIIIHKTPVYCKVFQINGTQLNFSIPNYSSVNELLSLLSALPREKRDAPEKNVQITAQREASKLSDHVKFFIKTGKVVIQKVSHLIERIELSSDVAFILGFSRDIFYDNETVADYKPVMKKQLIFINCDLCSHSHVGNSSQTQVLRTISVNSRPELHLEFSNILYHKVNKNYIDSIKIELTTSEGRLFPLGFVCLVLHVRPIGL